MKQWVIRLVVVLILGIVFAPKLKVDCQTYIAGLHFTEPLKTQNYLYLNTSGLNDVQVDEILEFVSQLNPRMLVTIGHPNPKAIEMGEVLTRSLIKCQDEPMKYQTALFKAQFHALEIDTLNIPQEVYFNFDQEGYLEINVVTHEEIQEFASLKDLIVVVSKMGNVGKIFRSDNLNSDLNYQIPYTDSKKYVYPAELFVLILNSFLTREFITELPAVYNMVLFVVFSMLMVLAAVFIHSKSKKLWYNTSGLKSHRVLCLYCCWQL